MNYDTKIASAQKVVNTHNENVSKRQKIDWDTFLENLQEIGGTTEQSLSQCSWEDLMTCGLPRLLARQIAKEFRKKSEDDGRKSGYVSARKAEMMTIKELVERYNPKEGFSTVSNELKKRVGNKKCIAMSNEGQINVKETVKLIDGLLSGYPERDIITTEESPYMTVYKIGEKPDSYAKENPLYPNNLLFIGDICGQTNRSWLEIPLEVRQLLYIAVKITKEIKINSIQDAHNILDMLMSEENKNFNVIASRYPRAAFKYDEMLKTNSLPSLKIKLNSQGMNASSDNTPWVMGKSNNVKF